MAQRTSTPSVTSFNCRGCGTLVERPPTRGQRPKWCSKCRVGLRERACRGCGTVSPMWTKTKFCSPECRPKRTPKVQAVALRIWTAGKCRWCDRPYVSSRSDASYCRDSCKSAAKAHRRWKVRGEFTVSRADRIGLTRAYSRHTYRGAA